MQTQNVSGEAGPAHTEGHRHGEAPKITPAIIEAEIVHETYFTAADGFHGMRARSPADSGVQDQVIPESLELLTFCVLTLTNGFTVVGKGACASPANFNAEIGRTVARGDAVRQIWPLLGYELRTRLFLEEAGCTHFHRETCEGMHA